ncbi:MAG: hypothetical protein ACLVL6_06040 [Clostridium paraputrificum]|uniref:hypothetical protein n=1 Tax=Clostridium paraputrificum TaxID=29363 RepID=UPI000EA36D03|nr:hypothetical protein [Clostridium paraputrificum]RKI48034.1 hypothetical protein D7V67_08900 [Clostridium paraputrificum]
MEERIKEVIKNYLESIGVDKRKVEKKLEDTKEVLLLVLPEVCILKKNRPGSASKQSHIHVTGEGMSFFFDENELKNNPTQFENDEKEEVTIFTKNLENLAINAKTYHNVQRIVYVNTDDEFIKTFTNKKVGHKGTQVQISKTRLDDKVFINLRECLFKGDALIFLKLVDNSIIAVGIPNSYFSRTGLGSNNLYEKVKPIIVQEESDSNLRKVDYTNIATFNPSDEDDDNYDKNKTFDLSSGILKRKKRTERHQDIVKLIALDLARAGYSLYENPVDCLATKEKYDSLLFEIKTLDGTNSDERKQVQKAFVQLFYYEEFNIRNYTEEKVKKIAVFENKISDEHILFFKKNGINVYWIDNNIHLVDENGEVRF